MDAERLGESARDIKGEAEAFAFLLCSGSAFSVFRVIAAFFVFLVLRRSVVAIRALQSPQEEGRQPRILFQRARRAIRALASAVPRICSKATRPTTSQTYARYPRL